MDKISSDIAFTPSVKAVQTRRGSRATYEKVELRGGFRTEVTARAEHTLARKPDGKLHLDRVTVRVEDGRYVVASVGKQESNTLAATAMADGLALIPDGDGVSEGDDVRVMLLN